MDLVSGRRKNHPRNRSSGGAFAASGAAGIGRASPSLRLLVWRSRCFAVGACSAARFLRREAVPGERALMWSPSNVERTRVSAVYRLVPSANSWLLAACKALEVEPEPEPEPARHDGLCLTNVRHAVH